MASFVNFSVTLSPHAPYRRQHLGSPLGVRTLAVRTRLRARLPSRIVRCTIAGEETKTVSDLADAIAVSIPPPRILICGAPASGKGTQCANIVETYGVVHISTGDMLRAAVKEGSELGHKAHSYMNAGELVPDSLVIEMLVTRLAEPDCAEKGWLLDGFPRTALQAEALEAAGVIPGAVVVLNVPDDVLLKRIVGRRIDPVTGGIFHVDFYPPRNKIVADRLVQRSDDTEEKAKVRLDACKKNSKAIEERYLDTIVHIDGNRSENAIFKDIKMVVDKSLRPGYESVAQKASENGTFTQNGAGDLLQATTWPPRILISGAPASGKGTQCAIIVDKYGVVHISTGDMLRAAVKAGTDLGKHAEGFMTAGELVPDDLVIEMLVARLGEQDCLERGWLLDGFPRTAVQAEALASVGIVPTAVVVLDVPDDVLVKRVVGRRMDPETGDIYHVDFNPPESEEIANRLTQRLDDTDEHAKVRLATFKEHARSVEDKYSDILVRINGNRNKAAIFEDINTVIESSVNTEVDDIAVSDVKRTVGNGVVDIDTAVTPVILETRTVNGIENGTTYASNGVVKDDSAANPDMAESTSTDGTNGAVEDGPNFGSNGVEVNDNGTGPVIDEKMSTKGIPVAEFVRRAEEAYEKGVLTPENVNWSGQAAMDGPGSDGVRNLTDVLKRPDVALGDTLAFLIFAYVGRASHGHPVPDFIVLKTAFPFLVSWFTISPFLGAYTRQATQNVKETVSSLIIPWAASVPVGIGIRGVATHHSPPVPFAVVTLISTAIILVAWRAAYVKVRGQESESVRRGGFLEGLEMITTLLRRW